MCKYRLVACVCNDRQRSNKDKCKCECKELMDKGRCNEEFKRNPRTCECECEKSCDVGEYSNYMVCKCRKRQIVQLFDKCDEDIDGKELVYVATLYNYGMVCSSCTQHAVLLIITCRMIMDISGACFHFSQRMKGTYFNALSY